MLDNKVLTHYRIYGGNVSTSYNTTVNKLQETFMEAFSTGISMFGIIQDITRGSAYENYVELRIINLKLAYNFMYLISNKYIPIPSIISSTSEYILYGTTNCTPNIMINNITDAAHIFSTVCIS